MTFGARLRQVREEIVGISVSELSRRSGISRANINELESDKRTNVTLRNAMRLGRALGVSMEILLKDVEVEFSPPVHVMA